MIYSREDMKKYGRACAAVALIEAAGFVKLLHDDDEFTEEDLKKTKEALHKLAEPGLLGLEETV